MKARHITACAGLIGAAALTVTACAGTADTGPTPEPTATATSAAPSATESAEPTTPAPTATESTADPTAATTAPTEAAPAPAESEPEFYTDDPGAVPLPPVGDDTPAGRVRAEMMAEGYCDPGIGCTEGDFELWLWDEMEMDETMAELDQLDYTEPEAEPDPAEMPELPEYAGGTGEDTCSGPNPVCFDPPPPAYAH